MSIPNFSLEGGKFALQSVSSKLFMHFRIEGAIAPSRDDVDAA